MLFLKYLTLPVLILLSSCSYLLLIKYQNHLGTAVVLFCVGIISAVFFYVLERIIPFRESWNQSTQDFSLDILYYICGYLMFFPKKLTISTLSFFRLDKISVDSYSIFLQLFIYLAVSDFCLYWYHRAAHSNRYLIRFHNIHHSIKKVYFFNSYRGHPFDALLSSFVKSTPLYFMHYSNTALHIALSISISYGLFIHANVDSKIPYFLKFIFFEPQQHFSHHSNKAKETHSNFGRIFSFWDFVFKTYQEPNQVLHTPSYYVGSPYKKIPSDFIGQIISVFKS